MMEQEWLDGIDCELMLEFLIGVSPGDKEPETTDARRFRLFVAACCRRIHPALTDEQMWEAVRSSEQFADGAMGFDEMVALADKKDKLWNASRSVASTTCLPDAADAAWYTAGRAADWAARRSTAFSHEKHEKEEQEQAVVLREIFGNPFRPVTLSPSHGTLTVVSLARAIYDERHLPSGELDLHRLAVLADALEEAGAPDEMVVHLRSPGPHVRGCFGVDLCLGLN